MPDADVFDPLAVMQVLDRHRVSYVVTGGLGRVIHGSDELTDGIDIVPSTKPVRAPSRQAGGHWFEPSSAHQKTSITAYALSVLLTKRFSRVLLE
jgi:hypothetical protein